MDEDAIKKEALERWENVIFYVFQHTTEEKKRVKISTHVKKLLEELKIVEGRSISTNGCKFLLEGHASQLWILAHAFIYYKTKDLDLHCTIIQFLFQLSFSKIGTVLLILYIN